MWSLFFSLIWQWNDQCRAMGQISSRVQCHCPTLTRTYHSSSTGKSYTDNSLIPMLSYSTLGLNSCLSSTSFYKAMGYMQGQPTPWKTHSLTASLNEHTKPAIFDCLQAMDLSLCPFDDTIFHKVLQSIVWDLRSTFHMVPSSELQQPR